MLDAIARAVIAAPRRVLAVAVTVMAFAGVLGAPVGSMLSVVGFSDPGAESSRANRILVDDLGQGYVPLYLLVEAPGPVSAPQARAVIDDVVADLRRADEVARVNSPFEVPDPVAAGLVSRDGRSALLVAFLDGDESEGLANAPAVQERFAGDLGAGITVSVGGPGAVSAQIAEQSRSDLTLSEAIVLPLSFLVLIWVFGGVIAALIPLAVGAFAIVGTTAVLRGLAEITEVSIFAMNLAVALGLALAIDYSLLLVSRYREEIASGLEPPEAVRRTLRTAGRTVVFSAVTVALGLATMAAFPMSFLRSFAYGAVSVVALAAVAALVLAPAAILLSAGRIGKAGRRGPLTESRWYSWTLAVMRRPRTAAATAVIPLILVGLPFLGVEFGFPDDRILPTSTEARQVGDRIRADFTQEAGAATAIVITGVDGVDAGLLDAYAAELSRVPGVATVSAPRAIYARGAPVAPPLKAVERADVALITVSSAASPYSPESKAVLEELRAVPKPAGAGVLFTGAEQSNHDAVQSIESKLPLMLALIAVVMFVLLFALSGSLVIPLKALVLNVLSLTATFGAMVWIFQDGHLGGLGTTATGTLQANMPVLMFCITFGLSMDYEVFLISRIREFWLASDRTDAANTESVALGLASTGRIVTAAALIMAITFAGLIASQVAMLRFFGLGLTVAVLVDATVIRSVLLPSVMVLLGRWNWWAPAPLARLHTRLIGADDRLSRSG
ncbi:MMPL family transporter [Mycobacterium manitobense]|uniref:MMPL family transporter n=1 Tax=[Mycobacterium] manitobense TaxID=190147 RepID=A0A9X2Y8Q4_9MYCO|nr:MMPL family transporter [[Mycobacterium] manitobense]MCV7170047.1 MMPL family transporter [[Mycobacterium] manitobense]